MVLRHSLIWMACFIALAGCRSDVGSQRTSEESRPTPIFFDDSVTINNGIIRVGVAPSVGRLIEFGWVGGPNLIWVNDASAYQDATPGVAVPGQAYVNLGGDKVWPTTQPLWKMATGNASWPPDGVIDGGAWNLIDHTARRITIQSAPSPHYGITVRRTVELPDDEPLVTITNTYHRFEANALPVQVWSITQMRPPTRVAFDIADNAPDHSEKLRALNPNAQVYRSSASVTETGLGVWSLDCPDDTKFGSFGRWVAAIYPNVTWTQQTPFDPHGAYPELSSVQAYKGVGYVELEVLSPMVQLAADESLSHTVTWRLWRVPADEAVEQIRSTFNH